MAGGQEHVKPSRAHDAQDVAQKEVTGDVADRKDKIDADVDAILDEIDDVLEENAAEFVSSFVQKGGE